MSSTKDVDLKAQAREKAEELRVAKLIAEYSPKDDIVPPEIAPREYALTSLDPSSYPLSLTALSSKFGGSGNLLSLLGKTVDVPTSPPIAMSDFAGKGLSYRVNGRINIDRYGSLDGAGLFTKPSYTWDRNDNTFYPSSYKISGNPYRHALCNSFEFLVWLQATGRVSTIRTLKVGFRMENLGTSNGMQYTGYYYTDPSNTSAFTSTITVAGNLSDPVRASETDLVVGGTTERYVLSSIGTEAQKIEACKSYIENGFLSRVSMVGNSNECGRYTDHYVIADFDVVSK